MSAADSAGLSGPCLVALPSLRDLRSAHGLWTTQALAYLALFAVLLGLMVVDDRLFHGVSVWKKPAKFALSISVYIGTLAWFASLVPADFWVTVRGRLMSWLVVATAAFEMAYIALMAGLGEASHFNVSTPLTATLYSLMGLGAMTLTAVSPWLAFEIARVRPGWRADPFLWAVVIGLVLTFVLGAGAGGYLGGARSHWVDAPATDAGGLPLFDWTREGGDLRVAHFFGMHVMQLLPLLALALGRTLRAGAVLRAVALVYSLFTVAVFAQAVAGRPFWG
jgi:hypothetical protein